MKYETLQLNEKYYDGFDPEPEINIYCAPDEGLKIWEGYFETLLSGCYQGYKSEDGLLSPHCHVDGYYDEDEWLLPSIETAIHEIQAYDPEKIEMYGSLMQESIKSLQKDLLQFLEKAQKEGKKVYIQRI